MRRKKRLSSIYRIKMTKEFEEGLSEMCSLSFGIEEIGEKKGIEKGSINTLFLSLSKKEK